jgi:RNA recognition motif-containing protein
MENKRIGKEIFVTDISFEAEEEDLRKLFSVCGQVRSVHMPKTSAGQHKGIAFVRMGSDKEGREALNMLDETLLLDRCIRVRAARSKEERSTEAEPLEFVQSSARRRRRPKGRRKVR